MDVNESIYIEGKLKGTRNVIRAKRPFGNFDHPLWTK
jgi:hypothetical protein